MIFHFSVDRVKCLDGEAVFHLKNDSSFVRAANVSMSPVAVAQNGMGAVSGCSAVLAPDDLTRPVFFNFTDCGAHVVDIQVISAVVCCGRRLFLLAHRDSQKCP